MSKNKKEDPGFIELVNDMKKQLDIAVQQQNNCDTVFDMVVQGKIYTCKA
jgi:hypothetical protein